MSLTVMPAALNSSSSDPVLASDCAREAALAFAAAAVTAAFSSSVRLSNFAPFMVSVIGV